MQLPDVEARLNFTFPDRHRSAMLDPNDPIHAACELLVPASPYELRRLLDANEFLHSTDGPNWPPFLLAFASNGCGDYFAYDLRSAPPSVVYIDPDMTIEENLTAPDKMKFGSFDEWYAYATHTRS